MNKMTSKFSRSSSFSFKSSYLSIQDRLQTGGFIRALNYHNTPSYQADHYKKNLELCSKHFEPVSEIDLDEFFRTGKWHKKKPGIILAFYNGYRNNYDVIYPLLEEYGFIGWFFVATQFIDTSAKEQAGFALDHNMTIIRDEYLDGRYAMSWEELKVLDKKHVVASHTKTHRSFTLDCSVEIMWREIVGSKEDLKKHLKHDISSFAWLYGKGYEGESKVAPYLHEAGYKYLFSNLNIEKIK